MTKQCTPWITKEHEQHPQLPFVAHLRWARHCYKRFAHVISVSSQQFTEMGANTAPSQGGTTDDQRG